MVIQSDRYLTDKEKEQRTARQEAECQLPMLDGTVAACLLYTSLVEGDIGKLSFQGTRYLGYERN